MISKIIARSTRLARPTNALRRGGHGTPSYNEPGGFLFSEKVKLRPTLKMSVIDLCVCVYIRRQKKREIEKAEILRIAAPAE